MRRQSLWTIAQGHPKQLNKGSNWGLADAEPVCRGRPVIFVNNRNEKKANLAQFDTWSQIILFHFLPEWKTVQWFDISDQQYLVIYGKMIPPPKSLIIMSLRTKTKPLLNFEMKAVKSQHSAPELSSGKMEKTVTTFEVALGRGQTVDAT